MDSSDSDAIYDSDEMMDFEEESDSSETSDSDDASAAGRNGQMVYPFTRAEFLQSRRKQSFSLPDSLMYYIAKNPPSAKVYKKLIRTCKFFFIENPVIVVSSFKHHYEYELEEGDGSGWQTSFNGKSVNLDEISSKLWITKEIDISTEWYDGTQQKVALPSTKFYRSDAKKCELMEIDISFKEFMFLSPKCKELELYTVTVTNDDGSVVPVEKLVEALPLVKSFMYNFCEMPVENIPKVVTSATVQNLLQIQHFPSLKKFSLYGVSEVFDIQRFFAYIKENKSTNMLVEFDHEISEEYKTSIRAIVQEIIQTEDHDYDIPWFYFEWMDDDLYDGLLAICKRCG